MGSDTAEQAKRVAAHASEGQLADACFEFAKFEYQNLDPSDYMRRFDEMAAQIEGTDHLAIRRVVSIREGYGGTIEDFYEPTYSYLHEVVDRRAGLPITLATIWIEVGRRAGMDVKGVGLPGHFLVYAEGQLVDPFHGGEAIGSDEASALVAQTIGGPPRLNPDWLEPVSEVAMIERMLRNLHQAYRMKGESERRAWIGVCLSELGVTSEV